MSGICKNNGSFFDNNKKSSCSNISSHCAEPNPSSSKNSGSNRCSTGETCIRNLSKNECTISCKSGRDNSIQRCFTQYPMFDDQQNNCIHKAMDKYNECREWCDIHTKNNTNNNTNNTSINYSNYSRGSYLISADNMNKYIRENIKKNDFLLY